MRRRFTFFLVTTALFLGLTGGVFALKVRAGTLQASAENVRTVLDGVYNQEQMERGQVAYEATCSGCHALNLVGGRNSALKGDLFLDKWREFNLDLLYGFISGAMPPRQNENAVVLPDQEYLDILTYIVSGNGAPAGEDELTMDELAEVRFVGPDGPQPLPLGALVSVVGCLERSPDNDWVLTNGSQPIRSQTLPFDTTTDELMDAESIPLGTETFGLRDMAFVRKLRARRPRHAQGPGQGLADPNRRQPKYFAHHHGDDLG